MAWLMLADVGAGGPVGPMAVVTGLSAPPTAVSDPGFSWSLLGPLSLIVLLLLGTLLVLRFVRLRQSGLRSGVLSVIAQTSLSPSHSLYVVQAAGRYLLLGGAPGGLALLTELPAAGLAGPGRGPLPPDPPGHDSDDDDDDDDEVELLDDVPLAGSGPAGTATKSSPPSTVNR